MQSTVAKWNLSHGPHRSNHSIFKCLSSSKTGGIQNLTVPQSSCVLSYMTSSSIYSTAST